MSESPRGFAVPPAEGLEPGAYVAAVLTQILPEESIWLGPGSGGEWILHVRDPLTGVWALFDLGKVPASTIILLVHTLEALRIIQGLPVDIHLIP